MQLSSHQVCREELRIINGRETRQTDNRISVVIIHGDRNNEMDVQMKTKQIVFVLTTEKIMLMLNKSTRKR